MCHNNNNDFDVTMGGYHGAVICELIGIYIIKKLTNIINKEGIDLYRDDSLSNLSNCNGRITEKISNNKNLQNSMIYN